MLWTAITTGFDAKAVIALASLPISLLSLVVAILAFRAVRRQEDARIDEKRPVLNLVKHPLLAWPPGYVCLEVQIKNKQDMTLELASLSLVSPPAVSLYILRTYSHYEMPAGDYITKNAFARQIELSMNVPPLGTVDNWPPGDKTPQDRACVFLAIKYAKKQAASFRDTDVQIQVAYRQGLTRRATRKGIIHIEKRHWEERPPALAPVAQVTIPH